MKCVHGGVKSCPTPYTCKHYDFGELPKHEDYITLAEFILFIALLGFVVGIIIGIVKAW